jgi:hypothetical protein
MRIFAKRKHQPILWRTIRLFFRLVLAAIALLLLVGILTYGAILASPHGVSGYVENYLRSLNRSLTPYVIQLDDLRLDVRHIGAPVIVEATGVHLYHAQDELIAVPKISAQVGVQFFPYPRLVLQYSQISSPEFHADIRLFAEAKPEGENAETPVTLDSERWKQWRGIKSGIRKLYRVMKLEAFSLTDGRILMPKEEGAETAAEARLNADFTYRNKTLNGVLDLWMVQDAEQANKTPPGMQLRLKGDPNTGNATLSGTVDGLVAAQFSMLPMPEWLAGADVPVNVQIHGTLKGEQLTKTNITLSTGEGTYSWPALFPEALPVKSLTTMVEVDGLGELVQVKDIKLATADVNILAEFTLQQEKNGYAVSGKAGFDYLPTERLGMYWPLTLAPLTRDWAVSNLGKGSIENAEVEITLSAVELTQPVIPAKALKAKMRVNGAQVMYLPTHPPVSGVEGNLHFTGRSMELLIDRADYMKGTKVTQGRLSIPDFHAAETALTLEMDIETIAPDVARLFDLPEINLAKKLNLAQDSKGTASGNVQISAIIFSSMEPPPPGYFEDNFRYQVRADTVGLAQNQFMHETDLSGGKLHIEASNEMLLIDGDLQLFTVPAKLKLESDFASGTTLTDVKMQMPADKLARFGYPIGEGISGTLGVDAQIHQTKTDEFTQAKIDLAQAAVELPEIGLSKAEKVPGTLSLTTRKREDGSTLVEPFQLQSANADIQGKILLGADSQPVMIDIPVLKSGRQQASISYQREDGKAPVLHVSGQSLDLAPWRKRQEAQNAAKEKVAGNPLDFGALDGKIVLQKLWLAPDVAMQDVNATIQCSEVKCESLYFSGQVPNTWEGAKTELAVFNLNIRTQNGKRTFHLNAEDGGSLLAALDITNHLRGGRATIDGEYDDKAQGQPLHGKMKMKDFYLKEAPLITKILSLTSPTGIVNTLTGKGINFNTFSSGFTFSDGTITLNDTRANGSAVGFTTAGTVQLGSTALELEGTVVPAYMLNSALGSIPVVGELLTGGKGEGIIATNYSVSGTYDEPSIRVNPLSMLTPGFMRRFFDIFDAPTGENGEPVSANPRGQTGPKTEINKPSE